MTHNTIIGIKCSLFNEHFCYQSLNIFKIVDLNTYLFNTIQWDMIVEVKTHVTARFAKDGVILKSSSGVYLNIYVCMGQQLHNQFHTHCYHSFDASIHQIVGNFIFVNSFFQNLVEFFFKVHTHHQMLLS